ncbi:MAG: right-handed parallel beta-helix repeat-containing protein [Nanoarchaeota archaeon]|nr:right-handed parallel beta-helix repeat-containing protein [Nanoarchaeota archaeon]
MFVVLVALLIFFSFVSRGFISYNIFPQEMVNGTEEIAGSFSIISACQTLSSAGIYTLTQNITSNGTCFIIGANNIILNGGGYTIIGNISGYGITLDNTRSNITIQNFGSISNFSIGFFSNLTSYLFNSTIINNTLIGTEVSNSDGHSIHILSGSSNLITLNTAYSLETENDIGAITIYTNVNNTNITYNDIPFSNKAGIQFEGYNNYVAHNIINNTIGSGIQIYDNGLNQNLTVYNNTIINSQFHSINLFLADININITGNRIYSNSSGTEGNPKDGIFLTTTKEVIVKYNIINMTGNFSNAIYVVELKNSTISNNLITMSGENSNGIWITDGSDNINFNNNNLTVSGTNESYGIYYIYLSDNYLGTNYLLNNHISSINNLEIMDRTNRSNRLILIYNNSFGEIKWTNTSFQQNATLGGNIGLGTNLFIGNNTISLNTSAFIGKINTSANITLYRLSFNTTNNISRLSNYSINSSVIQNLGIDCKGSKCVQLNYSNGTLKFNITSFSSYSAKGPNPSIIAVATPTVSTSSAGIIEGKKKGNIIEEIEEIEEKNVVGEVEEEKEEKIDDVIIEGAPSLVIKDSSIGVLFSNLLNNMGEMGLKIKDSINIIINEKQWLGLLILSIFFLIIFLIFFKLSIRRKKGKKRIFTKKKKVKKKKK